MALAKFTSSLFLFEFISNKLYSSVNFVKSLPFFSALNVKYKISTAGAYSAAPSGTGIATSTASFTVTGLSPNTNYKFQIDASVGGTLYGSVETYCSTTI